MTHRYPSSTREPPRVALILGHLLLATRDDFELACDTELDLRLNFTCIKSWNPSSPGRRRRGRCCSDPCRTLSFWFSSNPWSLNSTPSSGHTPLIGHFVLRQQLAVVADRRANCWAPVLGHDLDARHVIYNYNLSGAPPSSSSTYIRPWIKGCTCDCHC